MKKIIIYTIFLLVFSINKLVALDETLEFSEDLRKPTLQFDFGLLYGLSATDFFKTYKTILGGNNDRIQESLKLGLSFKTWSGKKVRLGGSVGYYTYKFDAGYTSTHYLNGNPKYVRNVNDEIYGQAIPVFFTGELAPYDKQFRSYVGLGIGAEANTLMWKEFISNSNEFDFRQGGKLFDEKFISPAIKIYTGIELGFDEKPEDNTLGSFIIDASYTYTYRNVDIFNKIKKQYDKYKDFPELAEKQLFAPGYLTITFSLSLNLQRNYKKT